MILGKELIIELFESLGFAYDRKEDIFTGGGNDLVWKLPMDNGMLLHELVMNVRTLYTNAVWSSDRVKELRSKAMFFDEMTDGVVKLESNRVEVIDEIGRAFVTESATDVKLSLQDNKKTLKVFLQNK